MRRHRLHDRDAAGQHDYRDGDPYDDDDDEEQLHAGVVHHHRPAVCLYGHGGDMSVRERVSVFVRWELRVGVFDGRHGVPDFVVVISRVRLAGVGGVRLLISFYINSDIQIISLL